MAWGDRKACFGIDVLFGEVDALLWCGVDDVDVDALAGAGTNIGGDDNEGEWIGYIPYALFDRV